MPRRVTACFPFSVDLGLTARNGQGPLYTGAKDATKLTYMLHSATGLAASIRAPFEGPHASGREQGCVAIEQGTTNEIVNTAALDALQLSDWTVNGGATVTVTTDYTDGPWGSGGPTASLIDKTGGTTLPFYYARTVAPSAASTEYRESIYVKVLSGTLRVAAAAGTSTDYTSTDGWVRAEESMTGNGVAAVQLELQTPTTGAAVTFLACCAQIEHDTTIHTSFVNGTRAGGEMSAPLSIIKHTRNFTFLTWVRPSALVPSANAYLVEIHGSTNAGDRIAFIRNPTTQGLSLFYPSDEVSIPSVTYATSWLADTWHQIGFRFLDGIGQMFEDGVAVGSATTEIRDLDLTLINLGAFSTPSNYCNGLLADTCFFDTALTATAIAALYTASPPPAYGSIDDLDAALAPQREVPLTPAGGPLVHRFADGTSRRGALVTAAPVTVGLQWAGLSYAEAQTLRDLWDANGNGFGPITYTPPGDTVRRTMHGVAGSFRESRRAARASVSFNLEQGD